MGGKAMSESMTPKQRGCKTEIKVVSGSRMWNYYTPEPSEVVIIRARNLNAIEAQDKDGHYALVNTRRATSIVVSRL